MDVDHHGGRASAARRRRRRGASLRNPAGAVLPAIEALAIGLSADERPIVLAIDEVQSIGEARCLRSLDDAVASLPEHVQLVLISRTVPALRLARLRTQGRLVEVGPDELAFTPAEALELFAAVPGVAADEPTVAALTRTTEGWAGVLYLAALWLRKRGDPAEALRTFRGSQRDVAGYLAGEALGDLDADARRFLRRTAVLPQLYGELCDAVLGESGSRERLRAIARANLLVMPLVERPGWYRCHALLRDHLLGEVDRADAVVARERALSWSRAHGRFEDAAEYARTAGDVGALLQLIDDHTLALMRSGRSRTIVRWVTAIPRSVLLAQPGALVAGIGAAHVSGRPPAEIRRLLVLARETDPYVVSRNEGAMLQIVRALYRDDHVGEALHEAQTAVELARAEGELLVAALGLRALLRLLAGDEAGTERDARAAIEHPDAASRPYGHIAAAAALAILDARAGRRHSARAHADVALEETRKVGWRGLPAGAPALVADAVTAALEGRLSGAHRSARQATRGGDRRRRLAGLGAARAGPDRLSARPPAGRPGGAGPRRGAARRGPPTPAPCPSWPSSCGPSSTPVRRPGSAEPLSPAELAVVRLLPHRTVREIAGELYLSANTIKSHVRAIYRKLGVKTREDAVARATALGLLEPAVHPTGHPASAPNSSALTGRPNCQPWPNPQPRRSTRSRCCAVSTPTAITRTAAAWPMLAAAATVASRVRPESPAMKRRSSLMASKRTPLRWASDCALPKSSIRSPMPASLSSRRFSRARTLSDNTAVSATSNIRQPAPTRAPARMPAARRAKPADSSWRGDRLTESRKPAMPRVHGPASRHARVRTRSPSSSIRPLSSATATNTSGATGPNSGWVQRASASAPAIDAVGERDDRLVGDGDRVIGQRPPQVLLEPCVSACRAAGRHLVEPGQLGAPGVLRLIHGRVGAANERLRVVPRTCGGDAEARGDGKLVARDAEGPRERAQQPCAGRLPLRAVQERHELVAAEARQRRRRASLGAQPLGHRDQQRIADRVPETVVDGLEVIEIDERDRPQIAVRRRERRVESRGEQARGSPVR